MAQASRAHAGTRRRMSMRRARRSHRGTAPRGLGACLEPASELALELAREALELAGAELAVEELRQRDDGCCRPSAQSPELRSLPAGTLGLAARDFERGPDGRVAPLCAFAT